MSEKPKKTSDKETIARREARLAAEGKLVTPFRPGKRGAPHKTLASEIEKREWNEKNAEAIRAGQLVAFPVDELFIAAAERAAAAAALRPKKPAAPPPETDAERERNARERLRDGGTRLDQRPGRDPFAESNWRAGGWRGGGLL